MRRGSATMSLAPLETARLTRSASTGWVSVVLVPVAKMSLAFSNSAMELVIAPRPTMTAIPAIVGAWSGARAVVDVVGADDGAGQLLHEEVALAGGASRAPQGEGVGAGLGLHG